MKMTVSKAAAMLAAALTSSGYKPGEALMVLATAQRLLKGETNAAAD